MLFGWFSELLMVLNHSLEVLVLKSKGNDYVLLRSLKTYNKTLHKFVPSQLYQK